ncbi:MAG: N-acetylmuramoyl-L-alanine amidase [Candidatus Moraniibacteriota bacterium]
MTRLFLALVSFLTVSLGGLWYGSSTDAPLDQAAFENEPLTLENKSVDILIPGAVTPKDTPEVPVAAPQTPPLPPSTSGEILTEKPTESSMPAPSSAGGPSITSRLLRFGYRVPPAPRSIDTIVLHSSYNALGGDPYLVDKVITEYEGDGVGAHYLIDRTGTVYRLIDEANIAYHAGTSKMPDGRKNVNDFSIGIEIIATEDSGYTDKQYTAVNALIADIRTRYKIKSVVGHADIAPGRKTDPWKFDWKRLK